MGTRLVNVDFSPKSNERRTGIHARVTFEGFLVAPNGTGLLEGFADAAERYDLANLVLTGKRNDEGLASTEIFAEASIGDAEAFVAEIDSICDGCSERLADSGRTQFRLNFLLAPERSERDGRFSPNGTLRRFFRVSRKLFDAESAFVRHRVFHPATAVEGHVTFRAATFDAEEIHWKLSSELETWGRFARVDVHCVSPDPLERDLIAPETQLWTEDQTAADPPSLLKAPPGVLPFPPVGDDGVEFGALDKV